MGRTARACLLAITCIAPIALAQQRSPAFVTVVDANGKPVANADVTCVFTPDETNPWPRDALTATTDDRGRARCDLLLQRLYVCWAIGAADEHGARLSSDPLPLLASGRVVELRAIDRCLPRRVRLDGHAAWHEVGATKLRWFPDAREDVSQTLPWPTGDAIDLVALPCAAGCIALVDARDDPLVTACVPQLGDAPVTFPPPSSFTARVTDEHDGPLAGAHVVCRVPRHAGAWALLRSRFAIDTLVRNVGDTDGDGRLAFVAPTPQPSRTRTIQPLAVTASKAGYARQTQGVCTPSSIAFALPAENRASFRVRGDGDTRLEIGAVVFADLRLDGGGMQFVRHFVPVSGQQPVWSVHEAGTTAQPRLLLLGTTPGAVVHDWTQPSAADLTIDLGTMRRVDVRTEDTNGGPLAAAIAVGRVGDSHPIQWGAALPTNTAGRARVLVPPGSWFVYAATTGAHALAIVPDEPRGPLRLRLEPLPRRELRVVDARGASIAGARVFGQETSHDNLGRDDLENVWRAVANATWWSYAAMCRSDADGLLRIPDFSDCGLVAKVVVCSDKLRSGVFVLDNDTPRVVTLKD